jgi:hypothetical protein
MEKTELRDFGIMLLGAEEGTRTPPGTTPH